ncbi:AraC-like ligand-binding domain-containing protein [Streptomyces specialis]|uniref:AraC-like ligand-binding domain-containing protein n=1 Tax=Streptomyces specialis TaxID=498367 RepID=UPI00099EDA05|nr:helix-turn-helix domain-containing protein [Streptomyces specialis]
MLREVFDTDRLAPDERWDAWYELTRGVVMPTVLSCERRDRFRASARVLELGSANVNRMSYASLRAERTPATIRRSDPELFVVGLMLRGRHTVAQSGREATLWPYDLTLLSSSRPYDTRISSDGGQAATVSAHVPRSALPLSARAAERLVATRLSGREGIGALLAQFLTGLATDPRPCRPADALRLGTVLTDLVGAWLAHHAEAHTSLPAESRQRVLFLRVQGFVRRHLSDPGLSPAVIAAAHHISVRYLHRLFQQHQLSVQAWIRGQRLDGSRRDLADPALAAVRVGEIARRWGFSDASAFSRAFRAAYGVPPGEYRGSVQMSVPPPGSRSSSVMYEQ